jgi:hypothetical protein
MIAVIDLMIWPWSGCNRYSDLGATWNWITPDYTTHPGNFCCTHMPFPWWINDPRQVRVAPRLGYNIKAVCKRRLFLGLWTLASDSCEFSAAPYILYYAMLMRLMAVPAETLSQLLWSHSRPPLCLVSSLQLASWATSQLLCQLRGKLISQVLAASLMSCPKPVLLTAHSLTLWRGKYHQRLSPLPTASSMAPAGYLITSSAKPQPVPLNIISRNVAYSPRHLFIYS